MIIKKFQGKTENEAIEAAKKEIGSAVVVMNVKTVKKKGLLYLFSRPYVEVTVALEEETEKRSVARSAAVPAVKPVNSALYHNPNIIREEPEKEVKKETMIEERLENLQTLLEKQFQKPEEEKNEKETPEKEETAEEKNDELETFLKLVHRTMVENEVEDKYACEIIDEIRKASKPGYPFDVALANTYQKMILKFGQPECITPAEKGPKVVFFVGPTGVGKTTTIAKIASRFRVMEKKKVALLTADTYRIAAAEQLRTYANILEVPFRVTYSSEEMGTALKDFKDYDYVLVDTAGHAYQNEEQRNAVRDFIQSVDQMAEKDVYLVLSATTKYRDLLEIAKAYQEVSDYKLIFTKLDETSCLGNLFNLKLFTGVPLSYVTCGQNVPDDIEMFNPQKTVKLLLGGKA